MLHEKARCKCTQLFPIAKEKNGKSCIIRKKIVSLQAEEQILFLIDPASFLMSSQQIQQTIADYFKNQPVLKAWIFGSYARGEQTRQSDVDILVELDYSQHVGLKFFGMYEDLKELLGMDVDLVTVPSLATFARDSVDRDKRLIYERKN